MNLIANKVTKITKVTPQDAVTTEDQLAVEEPLEIHLRVGGEQSSLSVTMRTPGNDDELAVGFLFTEGIIKSFDEVVEAGASENNRIVMTLREDAARSIAKSSRNFYTTSSCGVCGKSSIDAIKSISPFGAIQDSIKLTPGFFILSPASCESNRPFSNLPVDCMHRRCLTWREISCCCGRM